MTRFLNVPLDVTDVFIMTFMILQDSYMEPTRVGSDSICEGLNWHFHEQLIYSVNTILHSLNTPIMNVVAT